MVSECWRSYYNHHHLTFKNAASDQNVLVVKNPFDAIAFQFFIRSRVHENFKRLVHSHPFVNGGCVVGFGREDTVFFFVALCKPLLQSNHVFKLDGFNIYCFRSHICQLWHCHKYIIKNLFGIYLGVHENPQFLTVKSIFCHGKHSPILSSAHSTLYCSLEAKVHDPAPHKSVVSLFVFPNEQ